MKKCNGILFAGLLACVALTICSCSGPCNDVKNSGEQAEAPAPTATPATDSTPASDPTPTPAPNESVDPYTKIEPQTINGIVYDVVTFGYWPQTIKADGVDVDDTESKVVGSFTYYKGSDGEWYAKLAEDAYGSDYNYSDGSVVGQGGASEKYFKVEPIKWRVLTTNYNETGNKLFFAENILVAKRYDDDLNNYENSEVRAWLNNGFLNTAFSASEQNAIVSTYIDNSERSTNPDADAKRWNSGKNQYASDLPTKDKVFLLSVQEISKESYGLNFSKRFSTDYAKANGACLRSYGEWYGVWWLRSPDYSFSGRVHTVGRDFEGVTNEFYGIVPALCVAGVGNAASSITASGEYKELPAGTDGTAGTSATYATFGLWPQTHKVGYVAINESESKNVGQFTYLKGSDNQWYTKSNDKYYKVEPIKWRILTNNFDHDSDNATPGKRLLLAEKLLISCEFFDMKWWWGGNEKEYAIRQINGNAVYPNNYECSKIRACLNGLAYEGKPTYNTQEVNEVYLNKGFLQTAFTSSEQLSIAVTLVDNSPESTTDDGGNLPMASNYACANTRDKVFLLSMREATKSDYGFDVYNAGGADSARIRSGTDFSQWCFNCEWWLRSPCYDVGNEEAFIFASHIDSIGNADGTRDTDGDGIIDTWFHCYDTYYGAVPALCLE